MQSNKIKKILIILLFLVVGNLYLLSDFQIDCPFHKLTGLYCPGCGITRCLTSIIHLEFYQAFRYNPYVFLLLPLIISYIVYQIYIWVCDKEDYISKKIPKSLLIIIIITLMLYSILRNISYFSWLAPTIIN